MSFQFRDLTGILEANAGGDTVATACDPSTENCNPMSCPFPISTATLNRNEEGLNTLRDRLRAELMA